MKAELQLKLIKKYPSLFKDINKPITESLIPFGCECGNGWYDILDELFDKLSQYKSLYLVQVKEKFAGLRVYFDADNESDYDSAYKYIEEAYKKSVKTCEYCGKPGEIRNGGWLTTLCDECNNRRQ